MHGYSVFPHFNKGKEAFSAATAQRLITELNTPIIAIPEASGIVVKENQMRIIGNESVWLFNQSGEIEINPNDDQFIEFPVL